MSMDQASKETAFLGVTRSAKDYVWRERLTVEQAKIASAIAQRHGLPEILGRVLAARGTDLDNVEDALNPTLKHLMPDPHSMRDMETGAARLADAIEKGQAVAIFGDYDVDGATSSALVSLFLKAHGMNGRIYIPDRIFEGYGPNVAAIESLIEEGAELIVTVDCGTTSHEALETATSRDVDVVIVDHHLAGENLPNVCAVINPNRQDDISGLGHLCAAGVTFMLLVATLRELKKRGFYKGDVTAPDLLAHLDLVALATVCDVVPLTGLNRAFVIQGLKIMSQRRSVGLRALSDAAKLNSAPTSYHLGFMLGPRINAGGRIGDAALGARLLSTDDEIEARRISELLDRLNGERKAIETEMLEEANIRAELMIEEHPDMPMLLLGGDSFHKGVVGLVASRLSDRFRRPSCVIAWDEKGTQGTGSLRSIAGVDIGSAVQKAVAEGLLIKGGGHAMAAGLTVERDRVDELAMFMSKLLEDSATRMRAEATLKLDGALTPAGVTTEFINLLERAGPYGNSNPQPRFAFPAHRIKFAKIVGEAHIRCVLEAADGKRIDAISFRSVGTPIGDLILGSKGMPLHIAGNVRLDTWGGRSRMEVQISDVADPRQK